MTDDISGRAPIHLPNTEVARLTAPIRADDLGHLITAIDRAYGPGLVVRPENGYWSLRTPA